MVRNPPHAVTQHRQHAGEYVIRSTLTTRRTAARVIALLSLTACALRGPLTESMGFRPKPMRGSRATPAEWGWPGATLDTISRTDSAGGVLAWWGPAASPPCAGVLLLHGKGRNRAELAPIGKALQQAGFSVLVPDYRGYGGTSGVPSTDGVFADAALSYHDLRARLGDTLTPIVVLGHSMGTALAARLAREHTPAATVYLSPFTRISALVRSKAGAIGPRLFDTTSFAFNPLEDASQVRGRTLVVIAGRDALIGRDESNAFIAGLTPAPVVLRDARATHNGVLSSDSTVRAITDTLRAWLRCPGGRDADRRF